MKRRKGILRSISTGMVTLCVLLAGIGVQAAPTPEEYNESVRAKANGIEEKYGVTVKYPTGGTYAGIGTGTLSTLDTCLDYLTPELVKALSAWCKEETGKGLAFSFTANPDYAGSASGHAVAGYTQARSLIEIVLPSGYGTGNLTGSSPIAIVHEMGHVLQEYLKSVHGAANLSSQWKKLNGGVAYGASKWSRTVFTSAYAAGDYEEDFADTVAYGFVCNRAGLSIAKYLKTAEDVDTPLGAKVNYLGRLLKKYFPENEQVLTNLAKCRQAASSLTWNGLKLSGNSLEYIGFNPPYNVLGGVLRQLELKQKSSVWVYEVGGWLVTDATGAQHLVFPGGSHFALKEAKAVETTATDDAPPEPETPADGK